MAQQHLGSDGNGANPSATLDVTMSLAVAVGDEIVVWQRRGSGGTAVPTDTIGNTYVAQAGPTSSLACYSTRSVGSAAAAGNIVTVSQSSSARIGAAVHHLRGMDASAFDVAPTITAAAQSATNQFTTTQANEIIIAAMGDPGGAPTPEADYGGANDEGDATGRVWTCHRIATGILTNEVVSWTGTTGACGAAAFKEAAAAGGRTTKNTRACPLGERAGMGFGMAA